MGIGGLLRWVGYLLVKYLSKNPAMFVVALHPKSGLNCEVINEPVLSQAQYCNMVLGTSQRNDLPESGINSLPWHFSNLE